jgi:hypothetical protein
MWLRVLSEQPEAYRELRAQTVRSRPRRTDPPLSQGESAVRVPGPVARALSRQTPGRPVAGSPSRRVARSPGRLVGHPARHPGPHFPRMVRLIQTNSTKGRTSRVKGRRQPASADAGAACVPGEAMVPGTHPADPGPPSWARPLRSRVRSGARVRSRGRSCCLGAIRGAGPCACPR